MAHRACQATEVAVAEPGRPRKANARVGRTYKFPPELIERYEARAAKLGITRTQFIERAIEAALGGASASPVLRPAAPREVKPMVDPGVARAAAFRAAHRR